MHPGNLFVDITDPSNPTYLGLILVSWVHYHPQTAAIRKPLGFFNRDYAKVAQLHVDCGWVPATTRVDQFESAIRSICEPIFQKPMNEISLGIYCCSCSKLLSSLIWKSSPQPMLLQNPPSHRRTWPRIISATDLWYTAKPIIEKWVKEQKHPKKIIKTLLANWQPTAQKIIDTPSLLFDVLDRINTQPIPQTDTYTTPKRSRAQQ